MIELHDLEGRTLYVDPANVALIAETRGSTAYSGAQAHVTLYTPAGQVLGVTQKAKHVAELVRKAKEPAAQL